MTRLKRWWTCKLHHRNNIGKGIRVIGEHETLDGIVEVLDEPWYFCLICGRALFGNELRRRQRTHG